MKWVDFLLKKKIKENNTIKFINVFEYQTEYENNNNTLQYNVNSYKFYNENIINNFNIELETMSNNKLSYTTEKDHMIFIIKLLYIIIINQQFQDYII